MSKACELGRSLITGKRSICPEFYHNNTARGILRATPESDEIVVYGGGPGISTSIVQAAYNKFAPLFRRYLGNTVQQTQFSATTNDFSFSPQRKNTTLVVYGTAMQLAATHFGKVDGRVARVTGQPCTRDRGDDDARNGEAIGDAFRLNFHPFANLFYG